VFIGDAPRRKTWLSTVPYFSPAPPLYHLRPVCACACASLGPPPILILADPNTDPGEVDAQDLHGRR
jgi:hypothetical protein